jgi:hypothetical protein
MPSADKRNLSGPESDPRGERNDSPLSGTEVLGGTPVSRTEQPVALVSIFIEAVWAWIEGIRMRLKIERDLGRNPTDGDLTSISTWMKVDEIEQRKKPINPLK